MPQNSNDEPASVLLERINAEREAAEAKGKGKKAKGPFDPVERLFVSRC